MALSASLATTSRRESNFFLGDQVDRNTLLMRSVGSTEAHGSADRLPYLATLPLLLLRRVPDSVDDRLPSLVHLRRRP